MIEGVIIEPLKVISDDRGAVMHMMRNDSSYFKQFGEVYFSKVNAGFVKGWKKHFKATQHFTVPVGEIKLVLYDGRENSATKEQVQEIYIGETKYNLVRIPPLVWYAFGSLGNKPALVCNCTDLPHDSRESLMIALGDKKIPYKWQKSSNV